MNLWGPAANQSYLHPTYFQNHHDNLNSAFWLTSNGLTGIFANIANHTLSNKTAGYDQWMTQHVSDWMYRGIVQEMKFTNVTSAYCTAGFMPRAASVMANVGSDTSGLQNGALYRIQQMIK